MAISSLDFDRILRLRLVVARFGEMDMAKWWNSRGQLGPLGAAALKRGFPRTHYYAQARAVFAVARHRCEELFHPPGCVTLWALPEAAEAEFELRWARWTEQADDWRSFFESIQTIKSTELLPVLKDFGLHTDSVAAAMTDLRVSAEGRAVAIPTIYSGTNSDIDLLAAAFALGKPGAPAVPYMRLP
jgi:hypothetical protein